MAPASRSRLLRELRHDHVLHGLHRAEVQNNAALRVRLEEPRLDALSGLDEEGMDPPGLRLKDQVREHAEDLSVFRHHGLPPKFRREVLHSKEARILGTVFCLSGLGGRDIGMRPSEKDSNRAPAHWQYFLIRRAACLPPTAEGLAHGRYRHRTELFR